MARKTWYKISVWLQALLYMGGGINHFIHPDGYVLMIPYYLPFKDALNIITGIIEIMLGIFLVAAPSYRKFIVGGIILLLVALLPAHLYHVQQGGCIEGSMCIPLWAAYLRVGLQFLLMYWAWSVRKIK